VALGLPSKLIEARAHINWEAIEADLAWSEQPQQAILAYPDPQYPALLRCVASPPLVLYICGRIESLAKPSLAIVGSRQPSALGKETAYALAQASAALGLVVCSGLAYGIDAAAHRGALAANGVTCAVLGSGLNHIYPRVNLALSAAVAENGLLISEFSPNTRPQAHNFPKRNRIISGLSVGVLVVEATAHSGSLITARCALEQGREVFAVPGSIYNHLSRGCHLLIRQGAKLVESIQDIVEELTNTVDFFNNKRQDGKHLINNLADAKIATLSEEQQKLWQMLDDGASSLEQLIHRSQMSLTKLRHSLVHLELQGYVRVVPGGYQRCWPKYELLQV
jgi:DNA processing protein